MMTTDTRIDELEQQVLTLQRRLVEAEAKSIRAEEQLSRVTVEVGVRDAIAESPTPVAPAALHDVIRRAVQAGEWREHPGHGLVKMDGLVPAMDSATGNFVTPGHWLKVLQSEAPHLFQAPAGSADAGGSNPFAKTTWSLTEQGKLYKADPARAVKLAADAGIKLGA
jgi:hypothetical protein